MIGHVCRTQHIAAELLRHGPILSLPACTLIRDIRAKYRCSYALAMAAVDAARRMTGARA